MPDSILAHIAEDAILAAVARGEFEIHPDGTIWRIGTKRRDRWTGANHVYSMAVERADRPSGGYRRVWIYVDGQRRVAAAHRLVYRYFKGPIPDGLTINHEDGMKSNNLPSNLEPMTQAQQNEHARIVLKKRLCRSWVSDEKVAELRARRKQGETLRSLAKAFGISECTAGKIANYQLHKNVPMSAEEVYQ